MAVKIIQGYISSEDCSRYIEYFDEKSFPGQPNMRNALGYPSSLAASKINAQTGVYPGVDDEINFELGAMYDGIKEKIADHVGVPVDLCQSSYQVMLEGAFNGLHADAVKLDGTPIQPDGTPDELEFSGLLYLNNYGEDFEGGEVEWPAFDLLYKPRAGDLVLFHGDVEHRHEVKKVLGGERKNIVFFWAREGNVSEGDFFSVEYEQPEVW
jgi:hypothetical protein